MIGGSDRTIQTLKPIDNSWRRRILSCIFAIWPESYFENDELEPQPVLKTHFADFDGEVFIYKNKESSELWIDQGLTEKTSGTMIHFIIGENCVTWVIDESFDFEKNSDLYIIDESVRLSLLELK